MGCVTSVPGISILGIPETVFRTTGITICGSIVTKLDSAIHAILIPRRTRTTIHALTTTVFVALAVRNKAVASILTAPTMVANDIFLFTNAALFSHSVLPSLEPSSMKTV